MTVLDRFGNPIEREHVRLSLGFVRKELPAGEPETLTGITPPAAPEGDYFVSMDDPPRAKR